MKKKHAVILALKDVISRFPLVFILMIASIVGAMLVSLLPPLVLEKTVDSFTAGSATGKIGIFAMQYVLTSVVACGLESAREALITVFGEKITHSLRSMMIKKMGRMDTPLLAESEAGSIAARLVSDVDTVENLFSGGVVGMFSDTISIVGIMAVIFTKSKGLFVILLIALPCVFAFTRFVQKRMLAAQKENRKAVALSSKIIPETASCIRSIHDNDAEGFMERRYGRSIDMMFRALNKNAFYDAFYSPVVLTVSSAVIAIMMSLCVSQDSMMKAFGMSVGTAVALISYVGRIFEPLESLGMEIQNIQSSAAGLARLDEFMASKEREAGSITEIEAAAAALKDVTFSYDGERDVLKGFSMRAEEGEKVTLVGRTGCGKSTVFKLLLGLLRPSSGSAELGGVPAGSIADAAKRSIICCAEQRFAMTDGTVRDQVTLKDRSIPDEAVKTALERALLWDKVKSLPQGLDTPCTESLFSQGEFQLLSIARATVSNPKILLCDEITANLDVDTEEKVRKALDEAAKGRTVISISHRGTSGSRVIKMD